MGGYRVASQGAVTDDLAVFVAPDEGRVSRAVRLAFSGDRSCVARATRRSPDLRWGTSLKRTVAAASQPPPE